MTAEFGFCDPTHDFWESQVDTCVEPEQRPMVNEVLASIGQYMEGDYEGGCRKLDALCLNNMMGLQVCPFAGICRDIKKVCLRKQRKTRGGQK